MKFDIKMFFEFIANTLKDVLKKNKGTFIEIRNEYVPEEGAEVLYPMLYIMSRETRQEVSAQRLKDAIWEVLQELPEIEMIAELNGINIVSELNNAEKIICNVLNAKKIAITPAGTDIKFHIFEGNKFTHQHLNIEELWKKIQGEA
jgi:hypothetical protein